MATTTVRTHISEILDEEALAEMLAAGMIGERVYPEMGLRLYNYTALAQYSRTWTAETRNCRGLIVDEDGYVVARGFAKFANVAEHAVDSAFGELPNEEFTVMEKVDGSLGICYRVPATGELRISTRGSLVSDQAVHASAVLAAKYPEFDPPAGVTFLFEIIYPGNRIVVDYGMMDDLVLLAVVDNATGHSVEIDHSWTGPRAGAHGTYSDLDAFMEIVNEGRLAEIVEGVENDGNFEGFVLRFASGVLAKAKASEYLRLHKLNFGTSTKTVWETLAAGIAIETAIESCPDELYQWIKTVADSLQAEFDAILAEAVAAKERIEKDPSVHDRKSAAALVVKERYRGVIFALMNERDVTEMIWKMCKPAHAKAFAIEVE